MNGPLIAALIGLAAVAVLGYGERGQSLAGAALIGGFAGFALYHASFGFTAAWRRIVRERCVRLRVCLTRHGPAP